MEGCFYRLCRGQDDEQSFNHLIDLFGQKYALLAYFCFLKDRSKYVPIMPTFFDEAFAVLAAISP